jgi:arylsulfatase A-like enzyme
MNPRKQPNILFVFSDQHRWCDLGCYGNREVISPNFDRFAAEGLRLENCISNAPVCVPARGSLLTGLYPLKHGAITNDLPVRTDVESVADVLNGAGYHTGYIGKWHLGGVPRNQAISEERRLGFREWKVNNCDHNYLNSFYCDEQNVRHEIDGYDAETYTALAIDFIGRNAASPWGLWLSWGPPHDPYFEVPQTYLDLYDGKALSLRDNVPADIVDRIDQPHWDRAQAEKNLHGYYAHITALDEQFGRLFQTLEKSGQLENTIVVYTSDHGDMLGSQGWTNKQLPFDESIRVPLLAQGPGIRTGVSPAMIGLVDLPASLLPLAGLELPEADGTDLHSIFTDEPAKGQEACYIFDLVPCHQSAWRGTDAWRGVRTKTHTYACHADGTPWVLFDPATDPLQQNNLIGNPGFQALENKFHDMTTDFSGRYDALLPWPELLKENELVEAWNQSQRHFGLPELPDDREDQSA